MEDEAVPMLIECLYQEVQYHFLSHDQDLTARQLLGRDFFEGHHDKAAILDSYLDLIASKQRWRDIARNFIKVITNSEDEFACEFRFTINFMMRDNNYDEGPITRLIQGVKNYFAKKGLRLLL